MKLSKLDINMLVAKLEESFKKEAEYLESDVCIDMCNDITRLNTRIHNNEFAFNPEDLKSRLGWTSKSDKDIEIFFQTMCNSKGLSTEVDVECPFENKTFTRHGVDVHVMYGQGCLISISSKNYKNN